MACNGCKLKLVTDGFMPSYATVDFQGAHDANGKCSDSGNPPPNDCNKDKKCTFEGTFTINIDYTHVDTYLSGPPKEYCGFKLGAETSAGCPGAPEVESSPPTTDPDNAEQELEILFGPDSDCEGDDPANDCVITLEIVKNCNQGAGWELVSTVGMKLYCTECGEV